MDTLKTLEPKNTILHNLELYEPIDYETLKKLMNSSLLVKKFTNNVVKYDGERQQLEKYLKNYNKKTGLVKVKYVRSGLEDFGRVNPDKALGLHMIHRPTRHTICREYLVDIDIVNCHPVVLLQICNKFNYPNKYLKEYVYDRENITDRLKNKYNINRDDVKILLIRLINGGSFKKWLEENDFNKDDEFLKNFNSEMGKIGDLIKSNNKYIVDSLKDNDKKIKTSSIVAYYLQTIECYILEEIYKYCKEENIIKKICVLSNDGLMIPIENYNISLLDKFNEVIKNKFDLDLKFIEKPFNQNYTDEEIEKHQAKTTTIDDFFNELELSSHYFFSKLYYELNQDKYLFNKLTKWYEYDQYNKLIYANGVPIGLNNDISNQLQEFIKEKFNKLDPNNINWLKFSKIYKTNYKNLGNTKFIAGIIEKLEEFYNDNDLIDKIDSNYNLLAFHDKVYDLSINNIRCIKKDDFISRFIDFEYPEKEDENIQADILNFINSIMPNKSNEKFLLKVLGNSLFGNIYEKAYIMCGSGGNGKGVLFNFLEETLTNYYNQASSQFLTSKYKANAPNESLYNSNKKRFVVVNEPEQNEGDKSLTFNLEFLKKITSNESVKTRALYKNDINIKCNFTLFIQTNELPNLDKIDNGTRRRIVVVEFPFNFVDNPVNNNEKKIDYSLKQKFGNIEYRKQLILLLLKHQDCKNEKLDIPDNILKYTNDYLEDNNFILQFINDTFEITDNNKDFIKKSEIYKLYKQSEHPFLTPQKFKLQMLNNKFKPVMKDGLYVYRNLKFKEEEEIEKDFLEI